MMPSQAGPPPRMLAPKPTPHMGGQGHPPRQQHQQQGTFTAMAEQHQIQQQQQQDPQMISYAAGKVINIYFVGIDNLLSVFCCVVLNGIKPS